MATVQISSSTFDGQTLKQFQQTLADRMKYMGQTARLSIIASAISVLKSIRAVTKVAKPSKIKVNVFYDDSIFVSFEPVGGKKKPILRITGSRQKYVGNESIRFPTAGQIKNCFPYRFRDDYNGNKNYIVVAHSHSEATQIARQIISKRMIQYAGLARRAISVLMMKSANTKLTDQVNGKTATKALQVSNTREVVASSKDNDSGKYMLFLQDDLKYAIDAIKGGQGAVNVAMKKALNGITHQINRKIKEVDFFGRVKQLPTPFPEVKKK